MWYVIHTETGKEEGLLDNINDLVSADLYEECFIIKRENLCHSRGEIKLVYEKMFSGYVFVITKHPREFYNILKKIPGYAALLGKEDGEFFPIRDEEEKFIKSLIEDDGEYTVRLSPVEVNKNGDIKRVSGALARYKSNIIKKRNRLRYVIISVNLFGREREIYLGIRLEGDLGESKSEFQKAFSNGTLDDVVEETYHLPDFAVVGAFIEITDGPFEKTKGIIKEIDEKKHQIGIEIDMLGRAMLVWEDWELGMKLLEG